MPDATLAHLLATAWCWQDDEIPVHPLTVRVDGEQWRTGGTWAGLDFSRAAIREQASIMVMAVGQQEAPPDHHLDVPWCHPADQPHGWRDGILYRVRPARPNWRFNQREDGRWVLRRVRKVRDA